MTPGKPTVHRLLGGSTLLAALGALVVASATPTSASPLVWGNAQAWVADGDLAAGHSTAVSFGGDSTDDATADDVFGPLAEYAEISGESRAFVDEDGAHAEARVDSLSLRLTVNDLIDLGMVDAPRVTGPDDSGTSPEEEPDPNSTEENEERGSGPEGQEDSEITEVPREDSEHGDGEPEQEIPYEEERDPEVPESPEVVGTPKVTETPLEEAPEGLGVSEVRVLPGSPSNEEAPEHAAPRAVDIDGEEIAVELTMADVVTSASAEYEGKTEATFEHGDITVFGEPVENLEDGAHSSPNVVEIFDKDGELVDEVLVSVHFVVNESIFEDDDEDWRGEGVRSWLTVWIQAGDTEDEDGFVVDLADSWALGSLYDEVSPPPERGTAGGAVEESTSGGNLATTGSSLTALVTAAIVAVGGGTAATLLARKRTTAMDDQIED